MRMFVVIVVHAAGAALSAGVIIIGRRRAVASSATARRWTVELREERSGEARDGVSDHPAQHVQAQPDALWVSAKSGGM